MANSEIARILVVDDESLNRRILNEVLGSRYTFLEAKDGEQALRRARAEQAPDLILLDIMMPRMDGFEVLRCLKDDPATADIPVIFITGKDSQHDEEIGLRLGAVDYITKPFSAPLVLRRVQNQIDLKRTSRVLSEVATQNERLHLVMATDVKRSIVQLINLAHELQRFADSEDPDRREIATRAQRVLEAASRTQKLLEAPLE